MYCPRDTFTEQSLLYQHDPASAQPAASSSSTTTAAAAAAAAAPATRPAAQPDVKGKEASGKPDGPKEKAKESEVLGRSVPVPSTDHREQRRTADVTDQAQDSQREIHVEDVAPAISSPESSILGRRPSFRDSSRWYTSLKYIRKKDIILTSGILQVVRVRETRKSNPSLSNDSTVSVQDPTAAHGAGGSRLGPGNSNSIHFYDPDDPLPNSEIVTHLCEVFFAHLGCNFPFLQRDRFLCSLKEKQLAPILVDAVCALAARFSLHPLLSVEPVNEAPYPHHGQAFAHRAMCAVVDALACPTLAVVQACLLLAYEEFGSNHDSGLWMYLGISIRMAQDLGIQKLDGMKFRYGCVGLTPKAVIAGQMVDPEASASAASTEWTDETNLKNSDAESVEAERAKEREKVDLFWSIFFLDRVISSGTGRPVTLRDDDIEIHFPLDSESILHNGWPSPYPPLMRIIHLYGRMTDLLNSIKEVKHVTPDVLRRLAGMESDLTGIYQKLSPKLHFNVINFQTYVKAGQGTNFILLHFQLFSNSRELSISSAKTIADILAFAELIDVKSFTGNPFTSQPIYIAACAFLMESAFYSVPSSRAESPPPKPASSNQPSKPPEAESDRNTAPDRSSNPKHSLLAAAAKENYQRCYKALQSLEKSWAGTKYILTALDQKSKGIWDPLLYTEEEMESTAGVDISLAIAWKKTQASSTNAQTTSESPRTGSSHGAAPTSLESANIDPSRAIGWSLTGATNSSQPNLSFLYQLPTTSTDIPAQYPETSQLQTAFQRSPSSNLQPTSIAATQPSLQPFQGHESSSQPRGTPQLPSPAQQNTLSPPYSHLQPDRQSPSSATLNLTRSPGFTSQTTSLSRSQQSVSPGAQLRQDSNTQYNFHTPPPFGNQPMAALDNTHIPGYDNVPLNAQNLTIETQDIDMNNLQNQASFPFSFEGGFMPWLEYLPEDVLHFFGDPQG
ncbi:C6 transcription factor, putative [Trichophyton benhamiae CBS 112371]|uniref:C6 transcription factor, putative n=1 Tax=Arthroderma benhamiae (strain ATCC MYA-4681 / CBS 112371) TaxID=663331 RepID=D4B063_ARTBC|nr:C6 transcription factor, putative [Trichophyton benhamiae CBS 112371]EFE31215.1 C6 transcription factor, putative [Trichophyton benhamiae CBS 112371]